MIKKIKQMFCILPKGLVTRYTAPMLPQVTEQFCHKCLPAMMEEVKLT